MCGSGSNAEARMAALLVMKRCAISAERRSPLAALPGVGISLARNISPRPHRALPGDATLAGIAGAVIPGFGVAEERAL